MPYEWVKYLHVASAIGFVAVHGASIVVLYAARRERDRKRIVAMLDASSRTATAMYVMLGAIVGTGLWLGALRPLWLEKRWFWLALIVLVATAGVMLAVAKPFTARIRAACEMRPTGVPRKSDEELAEILGSGRVHVITLIGVLSLVLLLYLMVFRPALGAATARPPTAATTTTLSSASTTEGSSSPTVARSSSTVADGTSTTVAVGAEAALLALGQEVFDVTAGGLGCAFCHGSRGEGTSFGPRIAGESKEDIADALRWVSEMSDITLTAEELEGVARYVAQLAR